MDHTLSRIVILHIHGNTSGFAGSRLYALWAFQLYLVWVSLAQDYLSMMATSVSREHTFPSVGITISKCRNCLKSDIVEALQCVKCLLWFDLLFCEDLSVLADTEGDNSVVWVPDTKSGDDGWDEIIPDLDLLESGSDKVNHGEEIILMGLE